MVASIRIQHLQWFVGLVAGIGCAILGTILVTQNLAELHRAQRAVTDASRFGLVMEATDLISAERGPANAAMDPFGADADEAARKLAAARAATDRAVAAARHAVSSDGPGRLGDVFRAVEQGLSESRGMVDTIRAKALEDRSGPAIALAIRAMFWAADEAAILRGEYGRRLVASAPAVGAEVLLQADASALREEAGRLGSYAVMTLSGGLPLDEARLAVSDTTGNIRRLWRSLAAYSQIGVADPAIGRALKQVETEYFGEALPFAMKVLDEPTRRGSTAEFTRRYVLGLAGPTALRNQLGVLTLRKIEQARQAAIVSTLVSVGITALVLLSLLWLSMTFRTRLFRPLIAVREEILALSNGQLQEPARPTAGGPEITEMVAGLSILRGELQRKLVLEQAYCRINHDLALLAQTDSLTGLLNRRAVSERAPTMIDAAGGARHPVSAILVDIDHFKAINDTFGHAGGDAVLRRVAAALKALTGPADVIARYGGEEFLILTPRLDLAEASALAERMRLRLSAGAAEQQTSARVTASFGVACLPPGAKGDWETLVACADAALYRAKRLGRDRVCADGPAEEADRQPLRQARSA